MTYLEIQTRNYWDCRKAIIDPRRRPTAISLLRAISNSKGLGRICDLAAETLADIEAGKFSLWAGTRT